MSRCVTYFNRCTMILWVVGVGVMALGTAYAESPTGFKDAVPCENCKGLGLLRGVDAKATDDPDPTGPKTCPLCRQSTGVPICRCASNETAPIQVLPDGQFGTTEDTIVGPNEGD